MEQQGCTSQESKGWHCLLLDPPAATQLPAAHRVQALRPRGVRLMAALLAAFGDSPDPMLEGARLMELYQAQVVSTLR